MVKMSKKDQLVSLALCSLTGLLLLLQSSCTPFYISKNYGDPVVYGEGRHPGVDFEIPNGTPIIAAADGVGVWILTPCKGQGWCGGYTVWLRHGNYFYTGYSHLSKVYVQPGQSLNRGQFIGLSGSNNNGFPHLHFGVIKIGGAGRYYSNTYNPNDFWLDGKMQCFDPTKDYSQNSEKELTLPVACGDYAKKLRKEAKEKEPVRK